MKKVEIKILRLSKLPLVHICANNNLTMKKQNVFLLEPWVNPLDLSVSSQTGFICVPSYSDIIGY